MSSEEDSDVLQPDTKENVASNSQFEKIYQMQVEKLKILKGLMDPEGKPSKKEKGYLSIEKQRDGNPLTYLVFRNYAGNTLFSAVITKAARIKDNTEAKTGRFETKVGVGCVEFKTKKYGMEHCIIRFSMESDRKAFT